MPVLESVRLATASLGPLRRPVRAFLIQPIITVGMLVFLTPAGMSATRQHRRWPRVAFVDTRAYRADHEHEREAAVLQAELRYAADTDKLIDESLTGF